MRRGKDHSRLSIRSKDPKRSSSPVVVSGKEPGNQIPDVIRPLEKSPFGLTSPAQVRHCWWLDPKLTQAALARFSIVPCHGVNSWAPLHDSNAAQPFIP